MNVNAMFDSSLSYFSFKLSCTGGFNLGLIGSTCTAMPGGGWLPNMRRCIGGAAASVRSLAPEVMGKVSHAVHSRAHSGHHGKNICRPVATKGRSISNIRGAAEAYK